MVNPLFVRSLQNKTLKWSDDAVVWSQCELIKNNCHAELDSASRSFRLRTQPAMTIFNLSRHCEELNDEVIQL